MPAICLYFQIHQPYRLSVYDFTRIGEDAEYFADDFNRTIMRQMASEVYNPANRILLDMMKKYGEEFRVCFSISGLAWEQMRVAAPELIDSFREMNDLGGVEWVGETYNHSLASLYARSEFERQVMAHKQLMEQELGAVCTTFRNTEMLYANDLVSDLVRMGFRSVLVPFPESFTSSGKSPDHIYRSPVSNRLSCITQNNRLSAELGRFFYEPAHSHYPLKAVKFVQWLDELDANGAEVASVYLDYGVVSSRAGHREQLPSFLKNLVRVATAHGHLFRTPAQLLGGATPVGDKYDVPAPITWAYGDHSLDAFTGNDLQQEAINRLYELEDAVLAKGDASLLRAWSRLQSSDHFYYMTQRFEERGEVNRYSPYESALEAYNNFLNVLTDLELRVRRG
jgi:alpha-amylase